LQRHARSISRRQDHSRGLAARGRERRPERTVADIEMLAVRATVAGLWKRRQLVAHGRSGGACGRRTRTVGTADGDSCGEQERSADRDRELVRHLSSSLLTTCWRRVSFVPLMEMVTRRPGPLLSNKRSRCTTAIASIAYRHFQFSVELRPNGTEPQPYRRTTIMTNSQQTALARHPAPRHQERARTWIARLFSAPVVRQVSQATEWDNDVPPFPILAGAVAPAERSRSSK
jgi:hypothetical protein